MLYPADDTVLHAQAPVMLITGGSRGVGAATARLAAVRGYDVAISYISNGQPEEVAQAILWLASDEASFITGTFLDVTGGK